MSGYKSIAFLFLRAGLIMAMANIRESYNDINVVMRTRNVSKRDSNRLKLSIPFLKVTSKLVGKSHYKLRAQSRSYMWDLKNGNKKHAIKLLVSNLHFLLPSRRNHLVG